MSWRTLLVVSVLPLAAVACGQPSTGKTAGQADSAALLPMQAQPAAAVTQSSASPDPRSEKYETKLERRGGKLRITPVPPSYKPKVSKAQAFQVFKDQNLFPETARKHAADIRLGLYSNDEMYVIGQPPMYQNRPVWVIRYDNVSDEMSQRQGSARPSPGRGLAAPDSNRTPVNANILVFIDAETGEYLNAIDDSTDVG